MTVDTKKNQAPVRIPYTKRSLCIVLFILTLVSATHVSEIFAFGIGEATQEEGLNETTVKMEKILDTSSKTGNTFGMTAEEIGRAILKSKVVTAFSISMLVMISLAHFSFLQFVHPSIFVFLLVALIGSIVFRGILPETTGRPWEYPNKLYSEQCRMESYKNSGEFNHRQAMLGNIPLYSPLKIEGTVSDMNVVKDVGGNEYTIVFPASEKRKFFVRGDSVVVYGRYTGIIGERVFIAADYVEEELQMSGGNK